VPSVILETDSGHDVLRAFLADTPRSGEWQGSGDVQTLTQADGTVIGLSIRGYRKWADNRLVLVDMITRALQAHRDDVMSAVARLSF
jgi:hypothetical protein